MKTWKDTLTELDDNYTREHTHLSTELWTETRRLDKRTVPLGTDALGNTYWVFTNRGKKREFGGYLFIQTPEGKLPTGKPVPVEDATEKKDDNQYSEVKSWYFLETAEDIEQLIRWTLYIARKAARAKFADQQAKQNSSLKRSPNRLGQSYAVEIVSPRHRLERQPIDYDLQNIKSLNVELKHAAEWIGSRY